jgi:homoserine kinase type II
MSVFTTLTIEEVRNHLRNFDLGDIIELRGIAAGITNTNYFVITKDARYVLTVFERNKLEELPYFVDLMTYLAKCGVPCPTPIADKNGQALHVLKGKPALIISCLKGSHTTTPNVSQCAQVARALAQMHIAGMDFVKKPHNQLGIEWRDETAQQVMPKLAADEQVLLKAELDFQAKLDLSTLPHSVVHGDLFRDNVLFDGENLGGFIDFYYACHDSQAYDVAIAVNDWCVLEDGSFDTEKLNAFLSAYQAVRPFTQAENASWHALLRGAALRFWLSRLFDFHYPADGELTHAKDPNHFKRILLNRIQLQQLVAS